MAINLRCPKCKSDLKISVKKCHCGAAIPQRGKTYRVIVRVNGKRAVKTVSNLELAREIEGRLKADAARGEFNLEKKRYPTLQQVWVNYFEWAQQSKKSWYTDKLNYHNHLKPDFGSKRLDSISPFHIERLMLNMKSGKNTAKIKYSPATIKHQIVLLQRLYSYAKKKLSYNGPNPCFSVEKPTLNNEITEFLTEEELTGLLFTLENWPDRMIAGLVELAVLTGLRKGEILNLKWKDISLENRTVSLIDPKGKKDVTLPLSPKAVVLLDSIPKHDKCSFVFHHRQGLPIKDFRKSWNRIKEESGLPRSFRFHGLRHSFASSLVSAGTSLHIVSKLLAHRTTKTTERYSHLSDKSLRDALNVSDSLQKKQSTKKVHQI